MKFPDHHQLYITHNGHHTNYESIEDYVKDNERIDISNEDKQECMRVNEIWEIQWYPITPIGFYCVAASTLEKCLELMNKEF